MTDFAFWSINVIEGNVSFCGSWLTAAQAPAPASSVSSEPEPSQGQFQAEINRKGEHKLTW